MSRVGLVPRARAIRRRAVVLSLVLLMGMVILVTATMIPRPPATTEPTGFGFTVSSSSDPGGSWGAFAADVDTVAAHGQTWVRLGIASWLVAPSGHGSSIDWDQDALAVYDREISYIRARGLRVFLVTSGAPDWTWGSSPAQYALVSAQYWSYLAERFAGRVAVWQVFNEADTGNFRTFKELGGFPPGYLPELGRLLQIARSILHRVNPSILVTTNSTGFPLDDRREAAWLTYFTALAGDIDAVTLDLYPTDDQGHIAELAQRVTRAQERFGLPVIVGEIGMQTCDGCYSEEAQGRFVAAAIAALKSTRPWIVLVYEMRDGGTDTTDGESTFGIVAHDGRKKAGYDEILAQMHDAHADARR